MKNIFGVLASLLVGSLSTAASATTYTDVVSFLDRATATKLETFESYANGATSFADFSIASPGVFIPYVATDLTVSPGVVPTSGAKLLNGAMRPSEQITFSFQDMTYAFGVNIIDALDWGPSVSSYSLVYSTDTGASGTIASSPLPDGDVSFFGISSTLAFASISIGVANNQGLTGADRIAFDDVYTQTSPVPLPASLPLLLSAILGLLVGRRLVAR